jgi:formamidopyrimidine-DNA glycosylase
LPELPDVVVYLEALAPRTVGVRLDQIRIASPFVVRTVDPPIDSLAGRTVIALLRLGKRIVFQFEPDDYLIIHLMIAGRLRWKRPDTALPKRNGLAAFDFPAGTLLFTEASRQHRASLHLVRGLEALAHHDPGGLEALDANLDEFSTALTRENHTLKRALTDPRILSGIGNAYSDEILHAARLSPLKLTSTLSAEQIARLHRATQETLLQWIERLRTEVGEGFPDKVTAFREEMAVHGRYRRPCPSCGAPVQRIRYAANEVNYCAGCQTGGKLLADRAMSRLLKKDWPRSLDDWESRFG